MSVKYSDMTESQRKRMEVVMDLLAPLKSGAGMGMRVLRV
jgi:predicted transcriptional regulator